MPLGCTTTRILVSTQGCSKMTMMIIQITKTILRVTMKSHPQSTVRVEALWVRTGPLSTSNKNWIELYRRTRKFWRLQRVQKLSQASLNMTSAPTSTIRRPPGIKDSKLNLKSQEVYLTANLNRLSRWTSKFRTRKSRLSDRWAQRYTIECFTFWSTTSRITQMAAWSSRIWDKFTVRVNRWKTYVLRWKCSFLKKLELNLQLT